LWCPKDCLLPTNRIMGWLVQIMWRLGILGQLRYQFSNYRSINSSIDLQLKSYLTIRKFHSLDFSW
jgi:hypothetical protein